MMTCLVRLSIPPALMTIVYTTHRTDATNLRRSSNIYVRFTQNTITNVNYSCFFSLLSKYSGSPNGKSHFANRGTNITLIVHLGTKSDLLGEHYCI